MIRRIHFGALAGFCGTALLLFASRLLLAAVASEVTVEAGSWLGERSSFHSFACYDFKLEDMDCKVVVPDNAAEGKPWVWRARFWGHEPQTDLALLQNGFHVAYVDVAGLYGSPKAVARFDRFHQYLTQEYGLAEKTVLEGMSRGGLIVYNWAARNPEKVHGIYADAPVCDFKSWPAGIAKGRGSKQDWNECLRAYGMTEAEAFAYDGNPIDNLRPLAAEGVPLLHVVGDQDDVVPVSENTAIVEERYKAMGGQIEVIHKTAVGHHPHSLKNPKPIVEFILKHAREQRRYDGTWESLQTMPVTAWFDDGKIGIFIHWGPYSVIGYRKGGRGYAEHTPKLLYEDPSHYYPYMKERWGANPPQFGYKDIIPEFTEENWNPDEWAELFAEVGAKYVVLTAEHHDGFANWDSDLTPWNAVDTGPQRDLVGELGVAVRQRGLKYAPSYHRERHTGFFAPEKYVVHSEPRPDIAEEIRRVPEAASLYGPFSYDQAFVDDYVARWKEIQEKYHPDFLWIDDVPIFTRDGNHPARGFKPEIQYFYDQLRSLITDFMNQAAERGQAVYVNNKGANRNWPDGVGCLEKDNLKLDVIGPKWQSCTTFGSSFGYLDIEEENDSYKKAPERVVREMVEVVSRNGNFLINIGPMADGTIPPGQVKRLRAMGEWLKINGEAIYGTRYWKVNHQENGRLAFTAKGKTLYAISLEKPAALFTLEATRGWKTGSVQSVRLIGSDEVVKWELTLQGLSIAPPEDFGGSLYAWAFEIITDREQHAPNVIQTDAGKALKGTKTVDLEGHTP